MSVGFHYSFNNIVIIFSVRVFLSWPLTSGDTLFSKRIILTVIHSYHTVSKVTLMSQKLTALLGKIEPLSIFSWRRNSHLGLSQTQIAKGKQTATDGSLPPFSPEHYKTKVFLEKFEDSPSIFKIQPPTCVEISLS